ncbi:MAG: hypothetical protein F6K35_51210 [Okeania sp. SIO2H7]|nr:hypothetical protein [Okeania sp. SIO2H7]
MKKLPDEQKLLEMLELAKDFELQARETSELATKIARKWQRKLEEKRALKQEIKSFVAVLTYTIAV